MSASQTIKRLTEVPAESYDSQPMSRLNWLERGMVQHAHPTKLILDAVAYLWGIYLFSRQELVIGLVVLFGIGGLGSLLTMRADKSMLAQTALGKFFLVSSHPVNISLQLAGYIVISYGSWLHSASSILAGVTLVLLGHMWGWNRVQFLR